MNFTKLIAAAALSAMSCVAMGAAESPLKSSGKTAVFISERGNDTLGSVLVYRAKEELRRNPTIVVTDREEDSLLVLNLTTVNTDTREGVSTAYSLVIVIRAGNPVIPFYWGHTLGVCSNRILDQCAMAIVAFTDKAASNVRAALKKE